ncbi:hypothetical protein QBC37DRAFT_424658 [Rhypophila decipiens]|uniref:Carrier domain-containing protein n=1 Tax=Rhypophila decipiens TaxID=261697 RepID=A0AAN6Y797_9PEZI|nr:hypothetical protein QBC37DRAFT_424658 [Rhypophila decipiens]
MVNIEATIGEKANYGRRLMVDILDARAATTPDREWLSVPCSSNPKDGWKAITYAQAANAVNLTAHKIIKIGGEPEPNTFPTVAYLGPNDARYQAFALAAVKAGYQALFISPRNSQEGQLNLFELTHCHFIVFDTSFSSLVSPWLQERDMRAIVALPFDDWFYADKVEPFPYNKTFEQAEWDPLLLLHTSGTTGLPKPIVAKQGMMAIGDKFHDKSIGEWNGYKYMIAEMPRKSKRMFLPMPLYHAAGMYLSLVLVHYYDMPVALGIPDRPIAPDMILDCLKHNDCDSVILPPATLEEMSQDDKAINILKKLSFVGFGGGNLAPESGHLLVKKGIKLMNFIAATEFAPFPIYWQEHENLWQYFIFNSDLFGCDWRKTDEEGVFEQVIVRKDKEPGHQGFFYTFPNLKEYSTKDLYKPHPTLKDHWIFCGRADNIIVFSNGEKLNPVRIEELVMGHPKVKGAIVVGSDKFMPALIIEPVEQPKDEKETKAFIDDVWPVVVKANKETVAHGQIGRQFIMLSDPKKPFLRAGKGTIQRKGTIRMYKDEIDKFYAQEGGVTHPVAPKLDLTSRNSLTESIQSLFEISLNAPKLDPDTDFFSAGVDSMQVINASRLIRKGLEACGIYVESSAVATRVIYGNPTPRRLAFYLFSVVRKGSQDLSNGPAADSGENEIETGQEQDAMRFLLDKYTQDFPPPNPNKPAPLDADQTVLITGTTGALGSYLLDQCITSPRVKKIICLNRRTEAHPRQAKSNALRGLSTDFSKVKFLHADLGRSDLGLEKVMYDRLLTQVDRVIHNQWPVNFNMPVESFEPHIHGVRNLADFSNKAAKRVPIIFISSIASVDKWHENYPVPEKRLDRLDISAGGYGRSKLVSCLVLNKASEVSGVPTEIIRVGQIGGPSSEKGCWNKQEWLPSIIASSVYMGVLPSDLGQMTTIDWVPMEGIASMVLEVSGITQQVDIDKVNGYFHGINPKHVEWKEMIPAVREFYGERIKKVVPLDEWVQELEKSATETEDVNENPGVKLLDTYRAWAMASKKGHGYVAMDVDRTKSYSPTMAHMKAVTPELMMNWCRQWNF